MTLDVGTKRRRLFWTWVIGIVYALAQLPLTQDIISLSADVFTGGLFGFMLDLLCWIPKTSRAGKIGRIFAVIGVIIAAIFAAIGVATTSFTPKYYAQIIVVGLIGPTIGWFATGALIGWLIGLAAKGKK